MVLSRPLQTCPVKQILTEWVRFFIFSPEFTFFLVLCYEHYADEKGKSTLNLKDKDIIDVQAAYLVFWDKTRLGQNVCMLRL